MPVLDRCQPPWLTATKGVVFAAAVALSVALSIRLAAALAAPAAWLPALAGLLLGYLAADLLSGSVHWFCDTFFAEDTPVIGRLLIAPFRDHHRHPTAITGYRLLEQDGSSAFLVIAPLGLAWWHGGPDPAAPFAVFAHAALWAFAAGALGTNLLHRWAHAERVPPGVRWLQRRRLILSPPGHAVHHRSYVGGYCVTSGWLNPLLDRVRFFARLERLIRRMLPTAP